MSKVQNWDTFSVPDIIIKDPTKNQNNGGMNCYLDQSSTVKSNPSFQMPRMRVPFDLSKNEQSTSTRLNLELSVENLDFYNKILSLDQKILETAAANSKKWFGKAYSLSKLKELEILRTSIQGAAPGGDKYNPIMRVKVPTEGKRIPKVYLLNEQNGKQTYKPGQLSDITRGANLVAIVEITGIWFMSKSKFGITYMATHLLVEKSEQSEEFPFQGMDICAEQEMEIDDDTRMIDNIV
jgi:hypothetical protein